MIRDLENMTYRESGGRTGVVLSGEEKSEGNLTTVCKYKNAAIKQIKG